MARFDLTGKIALVAGASRGIGEAIAHGLAENGATVICTSRKLEACEKVADDIRAKGGKADAMTLHLGEVDSHDAVLAEIKKKHGGLHILINNGATNPYFGAAHETPEWAYDKTMDVNLKGPFYLTAKSIPIMLESGGGSVMTKAALINMTKGFAKEYSNQGIRVNALLPGFTDTKIAAALKGNPAMQAYVDMNLSVKRMAQPEEMVGAVLYMVSDEASYFTGQGMVVDGGAVI